MNDEQTITMTKDELLAYTEQVVKETIEKRTPALIARRETLIKQLKLLFEDFDVKYEEGFERNDPFTEKEWTVIDTARRDGVTIRIGPLPASITELRKMIKTMQQALRALEKAHERYHRRWEARTIKNRAATARLQAVHDNHVCTKDCDDDLIKIAAKRAVDDAPPFTRSQIITIRRILG